MPMTPEEILAAHDRVIEQMRLEYESRYGYCTQAYCPYQDSTAAHSCFGCAHWHIPLNPALKDIKTEELLGELQRRLQG